MAGLWVGVAPTAVRQGLAMAVRFALYDSVPPERSAPGPMPGR